MPQWSNLGAPTQEFLAAAEDSEAFVTETRCLDARGWPMHAFWCAPFTSLESAGSSAITGVRGGIETSISERNFPRNRTLPYRPIALGLAVDTAAYAALLWLIASGTHAFRRYIRVARGRCARCGYDARHHQAQRCPECGLATNGLTSRRGSLGLQLSGY